MRLVYIVTYDICDDKRLRQVFKLMRGYGDHLQYSVFRCELSEKERVEMIAKLAKVIQSQEDQILFFPMGPAGGQHENNVLHLGVAYTPSDHGAIVI